MSAVVLEKSPSWLLELLDAAVAIAAATADSAIILPEKWIIESELLSTREL
jgi:hypothetical protein